MRRSLTQIHALWAQLRRDENGATAIEWTMFAAIIAVALLAAASPIADALIPHLTDTEDAVEAIRTKPGS